MCTYGELHRCQPLRRRPSTHLYRLGQTENSKTLNRKQNSEGNHSSCNHTITPSQCFLPSFFPLSSCSGPIPGHPAHPPPSCETPSHDPKKSQPFQHYQSLQLQRAGRAKSNLHPKMRTCGETGSRTQNLLHSTCTLLYDAKKMSYR
jgi:hypothetical protein